MTVIAIRNRPGNVGSIAEEVGQIDNRSYLYFLLQQFWSINPLVLVLFHFFGRLVCFTAYHFSGHLTPYKILNYSV